MENEGRRRRAWIESLSSFFVTTIDQSDIVPKTAFHRYHHLNQLVFGEIEASAQKIERTPALVAAQNLDHIVLRLYTSGNTNVGICGATTEITQESFVAFDLSQPIVSTTRGMTGLNLAVPRRCLEDRIGDASAWHGQIIPTASSPIAKLMADHMRNVSACLRDASPEQMRHIIPATIALSNAMFLGEHDSAYDKNVVTGIAIRQFIEENLPRVDADIVMARFAISRTPLYKIFESDGGIYSYIRNRRLARAMQILAQPGDRKQQIAAVGYSLGFENDRVFSRAFRRKYGLNPSEVDHETQSRVHIARESLLLSWMKDL
ncbi:hypothetical protein SQ03_30865 [Methylobacterium platani JCM 14648]|uniref:HTH araC/xylS-type domain-containing protein n=1 Tax=Methylobacterium platani JCM 14648 TaxID=1295136 RepID=A0ABR5GNC8_9HYPH|nr:hypothetical protein SQ03_30865 [Methylobacterium platani JCM 14648]